MLGGCRLWDGTESKNFKGRSTTVEIKWYGLIKMTLKLTSMFIYIFESPVMRNRGNIKKYKESSKHKIFQIKSILNG